MLNRLLGRERDQEARLADGLEKSRRGFLDRVAGLFGNVDITDETWDELEARLIQSDVGVATAMELVASLRGAARRAGVRRADALPRLLQALMVDALHPHHATEHGEEGVGRLAGPLVVLMVGVNGSGKTTSIAKLASLHRRAGERVVLVAADTFRAAAIEQLQAWGERCAVTVLVGQHGADPGAVVFDALSSGAARGADVVIVDTAGRLHTQANLMAELGKIRHVAGRVVPGAPHETLLVLDATTGQNGLAQARAFSEAVDVTGILLAKIDSSAKGGVAFSVTRELGLPIRFVGTGEGLDDLTAFDAEAFVAGLLGLGAERESPQAGP